MMKDFVPEPFQHSAAARSTATCGRTGLGNLTREGGVTISSEGVEKGKHSVPALAGWFPIRSWLFASEFLLSWSTATFNEYQSGTPTQLDAY